MSGNGSCQVEGKRLLCLFKRSAESGIGGSSEGIILGLAKESMWNGSESCVNEGFECVTRVV